jgi:hypothetical protein
LTPAGSALGAARPAPSPGQGSVESAGGGLGRHVLDQCGRRNIRAGGGREDHAKRKPSRSLNLAYGLVFGAGAGASVGTAMDSLTVGVFLGIALGVVLAIVLARHGLGEPAFLTGGCPRWCRLSRSPSRTPP